MKRITICSLILVSAAWIGAAAGTPPAAGPYRYDPGDGKCKTIDASGTHEGHNPVTVEDFVAGRTECMEGPVFIHRDDIFEDGEAGVFKDRDFRGADMRLYQASGGPFCGVQVTGDFSGARFDWGVEGQPGQEGPGVYNCIRGKIDRFTVAHDLFWSCALYFKKDHVTFLQAFNHNGPEPIAVERARAEPGLVDRLEVICVQ